MSSTEHVTAMDEETVIPGTQDDDVDQPVNHGANRGIAGDTNQQSRVKRRASTQNAPTGPSRVGQDNNNNQPGTSFNTISSLKHKIYQQITKDAEENVQPAVSAIIKVEQQVVKLEKHLHSLMHQHETGVVSYRYLQVTAPPLSYACAEAEAAVAEAAQEYQRKLLTACIMGAEAQLAALKQEQQSIHVTAMLQMKQNSFGQLPDSWTADPVVMSIKQQQQEVFEWELATAKRQIQTTQQQLAVKEAKKAAATAAAMVETGPTTLQQQVEELVAMTVPKVLAANATAVNNSSNRGNNTADNKGKSGKQQQQQQQANKQQQQQQQQGNQQQQQHGNKQQKQKPTTNPSSKPSYLEAAAGPNRGRSKSRNRFFHHNNGASSSGSHSNRVPKGANQQQQQRHQTATG